MDNPSFEVRNVVLLRQDEKRAEDRRCELDGCDQVEDVKVLDEGDDDWETLGREVQLGVAEEGSGKLVAGRVLTGLERSCPSEVCKLLPLCGEPGPPSLEERARARDLSVVLADDLEIVAESVVVALQRELHGERAELRRRCGVDSKGFEVESCEVGEVGRPLAVCEEGKGERASQSLIWLQGWTKDTYSHPACSHSRFQRP